jgi:hypothetical protein
VSSRGRETRWALEAVAVDGGGGGGTGVVAAVFWKGLSDAAFGGELGVRPTSVLALGPTCRRGAPGVNRLQLHDWGHLPDRQSRAASHSRPHAGRRREGRARAQNCKDNEELHEYLERIYCAVRPHTGRSRARRMRYTHNLGRWGEIKANAAVVLSSGRNEKKVDTSYYSIAFFVVSTRVEYERAAALACSTA